MEEIVKKLKLALEDQDTAKELEKFGISADQIEGVKDFKKPATLDEAIKEFNLQSDLDKKLAKAVQTREENLKAKYNFVEKEQEKTDPPKSDNPEMQALLDHIKAIQTRLDEKEKAEKVQTIEQKKASVVAKLQEKGIPAIYANAFNLEEDLETQMETVEKQFEAEFTPLIKDKKTGTKLPFPKAPGNKNEPSKEEIEAFKRKI